MMITETKKRKKGEEKTKTQEEEKLKILSVMFVPYTKGRELARRMRKADEELAKQTGNKIKIVEKTGFKLIDTLHKADPWQG